jgi:hypothetical protein
MAPVFSRKAWRCIWHIIQVSNCMSVARFRV